MVNIGILRAIFQLDTREAETAADRLATKMQGRLEGSFEGLISKGGRLGQVLGGLGPAGIAAAAGLGALTIAVKKLVDITSEFQKFGSQMIDLSTKTQISTDALQEFAFAGEQVGVGIDTISNAVLKLGARAAQGLPDTVKGLNQLGLSVDEIVAMRPEDAFNTVAEAIGQIPNPAEQAAAAMRIFGKQGLEVLPLIRSDLRATGEELHRLGGVIDEDLLKAGDRLDDNLVKIGASSKGLRAIIAEQTVPAMADLTDTLLEQDSSIGELIIKQSGAYKGLKLWMGLMRAELGTVKLFTTSVEEATAKIPTAPAGPAPHAPLGLPAGAPDIDAILKEWEKEAAKEGSVLDRILKAGSDKPSAEATAKFERYLDRLVQQGAQHAQEMEGFQAAAAGIVAQAEAENLLKEQEKTTERMADLEKERVDNIVAMAGPLGENARQMTDSVEKSEKFNETLETAYYLANLIGGSIGSWIGNIVSAGAGLKDLKANIGAAFGDLKTSFKGGDILGIAGAIGSIGGAIGPLIGIGKQVVEAIKSWFGPDIARDVARQFGVDISEELADQIRESGKPIETALNEIFAEGQMSFADLAREAGDLLAAVGYGAVSAEEATGPLTEALDTLIANYSELGPEGEAQVQRIISAMNELGISTENLGQLIATSMGPSFQEVQEQFDMSREQLKALEELLGINLPSKAQVLAAELGVSPKVLKEMEAQLKPLGIDMDELAALAEMAGISIQEMAKRLGIEGVEGVKGLGTEQTEANVEIAEGARLAALLADNMERAARAAGGIEIGGGRSTEVESAQGGLFKQLKRDTLILAHAGELAAIIPKGLTSGKIAFYQAAEGLYDRDRDRDGGGGSTGKSGGQGTATGSGGAWQGGDAEGADGALRHTLIEATKQATQAAMKAAAETMRPVAVTRQTSINVQLPEFTPGQAAEAFRSTVLPGLRQALRRDDEGILSEMKELILR